MCARVGVRNRDRRHSAAAATARRVGWRSRAHVFTVAAHSRGRAKGPRVATRCGSVQRRALEPSGPRTSSSVILYRQRNGRASYVEPYSVRAIRRASARLSAVKRRRAMPLRVKAGRYVPSVALKRSISLAIRAGGSVLWCVARRTSVSARRIRNSSGPPKRDVGRG